jgi:hypothetical protein
MRARFLAYLLIRESAKFDSFFSFLEVALKDCKH